MCLLLYRRWFIFFLALTTQVLGKEYILDLNKLRKKLKNPSRDVIVSYKNHLGEGEGNFSSLPRYNAKNVNCTTWWKQLLAESFSNNDKDRLEVLDFLRYYHGIVSFGTRKHFLDHHLLEEPEPLVDLNLLDKIECKDDRSHTVKLNIGLFKKNNKFHCPLAHEDKQNISFSYLSKEKTLKCSEGLEDGVYMAFPIASKDYLKIWGRKSGPMGLVHGLIINRENRKSVVYHASIDRGMVAHEPFDKYILSFGSRLFKGYKIFKISPTLKTSSDEDHIVQFSKTIACENNLYRHPQKGKRY